MILTSVRFFYYFSGKLPNKANSVPNTFRRLILPGRVFLPSIGVLKEVPVIKVSGNLTTVQIDEIKRYFETVSIAGQFAQNVFGQFAYYTYEST